MTTQFGVHSEVGVLRKVMVCRPGLAHLRLTPDNCRDLLFDDVIWVQEAKNEHYKFVEVMRDRGIDVVDMHELLAKTLEDSVARAWVLDRKINPDRVALFAVDEVRAWLNEMPTVELAEFLIGGIAISDVPVFANLKKYLDPMGFIVPPLPNTQFTRDTTCWIYGGVTVNPMYWPARRQETLLATTIYKFHPDFQGNVTIWWGDPDVDHVLTTQELAHRARWRVADPGAHQNPTARASIEAIAVRVGGILPVRFGPRGDDQLHVVHAGLIPPQRVQHVPGLELRELVGEWCTIGSNPATVAREALGRAHGR